MAHHTAAVLVVALAAGCWHGNPPPEPEPEPVAAMQTPRPDPPRRQTRPLAARNATMSSNSPGPLAMVHQAWDDPNGCLQCHVTVGTGAPIANARCLGCHDHDPIAQRIATHQGLHASVAAGRSCASCHHEHKGYRYDLMGWSSLPGGAAAFDHALTGWPLPSAYRSMRCTQCHVLVDSQGLQLYRGLDRAQYP